MADKAPSRLAALPFTPRIRTLKSLRSTYSRLLRTFAAGEVDAETARVWIYAMSVFLQISKSESEMVILDKLQDIERRLKEIEEKRDEERKNYFTKIV